MFQRGVVKCLSLFFIVFLMCPKRVRLTVVNKEDYYNAVKTSNKDVDVKNVNLRSGYSGWTATEDLGEFNDLPVGAEIILTEDEMREHGVWHKGIIPYYIDAISFSDKVLRDRIRMFLNTVNKLTKLSFLELPAPPEDDETRWVFFANRRGQLDCGDHSVRNMTNEGVQHVVLGYDCLATRREMAEAVLSIVGVPNQHNAPDRNDSIEVVYENILPDKQYLFKEFEPSYWLFHGYLYDKNSASHFHSHRYSKNGQATIKHRKNPFEVIRNPEMGEGVGLTRDDVSKIRRLYKHIIDDNKKNQVPECDQMFRKGENFKPIKLPQNIPKKKPDQNRGINPTTLRNFHDDSSSKADEEKRDTEENFKLEKIAGSKVKDGLSVAKTGNPKLNGYRDPLLYLSDYQTEDEIRRKVKAQTNTTYKVRSRSVAT